MKAGLRWRYRFELLMTENGLWGRYVGSMRWQMVPFARREHGGATIFPRPTMTAKTSPP